MGDHEDLVRSLKYRAVNGSWQCVVLMSHSLLEQTAGHGIVAHMLIWLQPLELKRNINPQKKQDANFFFLLRKVVQFRKKEI